MIGGSNQICFKKSEQGRPTGRDMNLIFVPLLALRAGQF